MKTEEGNKLIAEFMNKELYDKWTDLPVEKLRFHSSWDSLMAVVEKINKWHSDTMCKKMDFYLLQQSICSSKEMVWEGCIEFIQWYNQNKSKQ